MPALLWPTVVESSQQRRLQEGGEIGGIVVVVVIVTLVLLVLLCISSLPRGLLKIWMKVHFYSTDRSRVLMYIDADQMREYKKLLAERPAGCCMWFQGPKKAAEETQVAPPPKSKRVLQVEALEPSEEGNRASGRRLSVSGVELGLIQPASPSGVVTDIGKVMKEAAPKREPAHHATKMLPLDYSAQSDFGFGQADAGEAADSSSFRDDNDDELSHFVLALLSDKGTWLADLPVAHLSSQVLGKEPMLAAGHGCVAKYLAGGDAHLSRQQLRVDADAEGIVSVTRLAPNPSYLQRANGPSHTEPEQIPKGSRVVLVPGDIVWLGKARYPLRLIERLPGYVSNPPDPDGPSSQGTSCGESEVTERQRVHLNQ